MPISYWSIVLIKSYMTSNHLMKHKHLVQRHNLSLEKGSYKSLIQKVQYSKARSRLEKLKDSQTYSWRVYINESFYAEASSGLRRMHPSPISLLGMKLLTLSINKTSSDSWDDPFEFPSFFHIIRSCSWNLRIDVISICTTRVRFLDGALGYHKHGFFPPNKN